MNYLKSWGTGVAAALAIAMIVALTPGADGSSAPAENQSTLTRLGSAGASAQEITASKAAPGRLTSTVRGGFHKSGIVRGTFVPRRFVTKGGNDFAVGTLHAVLRKGDGRLVGRTTKQITIPIHHGTASATASGSATQVAGRNCRVLDLVLGPLDLNLLGLKVHLDRVVLNIVAASGAGALLGNLICAVAGLLDGTRLIDLLKLANVLNRILSVLRV